jgi:23S rRNA (uracil1939-C5)-methyltransferase
MIMKETRVEFHGLAAGGDAVGRDETGRAVFVARAAPGDVGHVALTEENPRFARGRLLKLESLSADRVVPPCPFFAPASGTSFSDTPAFDAPASDKQCGGCDWQHIDYQAQLQAKRDIVVQALGRIGRVENSDALVGACIPSPQPFHYRNKVDFVVGGNSLTDEGALSEVGFYARESHDLVDITHCLIQQELNNAILTAVRSALERGLVTAYDPKTNRGVLRRVVGRVSSQGDCLVSAVTTTEPWPQERDFATFLCEQVPALVGVMRRSPRKEPHLITTNGARDWLEEDVDGLKLRATGEGFFQVNSALAPRLLQTALEMSKVRQGTAAVDLYCGVGLFALGLVRAGASVLGIEVSRHAIEDARKNAKCNNLQAIFKAGDAARLLAQVRNSPQLVLLDPPRAGAAEAVSHLLEIRPKRVVYVSCDPATLARDIKVLQQGGYRLESAVPLDMFPQTAHVETVASLELK